MRRIFIALSIFVAGMFVGNTAQAGVTCTVDSANCTGGLGAVCQDFWAPATAGTFYSYDVSFYIPDTASFDIADLGIPLVPSFVVEAPVISGRINDVNGLPSGLSYSCLLPNCEVNVTQTNYSCFAVSGTPCGEGDTLEIDVDLELTVDLTGISIPGLPIPLPSTAELPVFLTGQTAELPLINTAPALALTLSPNTAYLCQGNVITISAPAGFSNYAWSTGNTQADLTVSNTGTYTVTVTDAAGCTSEASQQIDTLEAVANGPFTVCENEFIRLVASGGDNFTWTGPNGNIIDANEAAAVVLDLDATTDFKVVVSNGVCQDSTTVSVTIDNSNCQRDCADCTPQRSSCSTTPVGRVCPGVVNIDRGTNFDGSFTFAVPTQITVETFLAALGLPQIPLGIPGIDIDSVEVTDVDGLPAGFTWETDQLGNGNWYYPAWATDAGKGCVSFCGNTCDDPGRVNAELNFDCSVTVPSGIKNTIESLVPGFTVPATVAAPVSATFSFNLSGTVLAISPTDSASLNVTEGETVTLSTPASGFTSFTWSTGATTASITVDESGTYTVTATDDAGCQQEDEVTVNVIPASGISSIATDISALNVYPNPNEGRFEVSYKLAKAQTVALSVLDLQGKEIYSRNTEGAVGVNSPNIELSNNAAGLYILRITTEEGTVNRKVTVE